MHRSILSISENKKYNMMCHVPPNWKIMIKSRENP